MEFLESMNAYIHCKISCVEAEGGKLIDTEWDVNKDDTMSHNCRSRLVGREYN